MVQVGGIRIIHDKKAGIIYISDSYPQAGEKIETHSFNAKEFFEAVELVKEA